MGASLLSCQNDDDSQNEIPNGLNLEIEGTLLDGGQISDISLYCIEKKEGAMIGKLWYEYYPEIKTVKNYDDFTLYLLLNRNNPLYKSDDAEEMSAIIKMEKEYCKEKTSFIIEQYLDFEKSSTSGWPALFSAYTNGKVSITCDKTLFGEVPGTNLDAYFNVYSVCGCLPVGIENPRFLYNYGEERISDMSKLFVKETWLQPVYYLQFGKMPSEKYDELTLHIAFPMRIEHTRDLIVAKVRGQELQQRYSESVFETECKIKFDWSN